MAKDRKQYMREYQEKNRDKLNKYNKKWMSGQRAKEREQEIKPLIEEAYKNIRQAWRYLAKSK